MSADEPVATAPLEPGPDPSPVSPAATFVRPLEVVTVGSVVVFDQLTKFLVKATIPLYA